VEEVFIVSGYLQTGVNACELLVFGFVLLKAEIEFSCVDLFL
jgi:hypothetical protein